MNTLVPTNNMVALCRPRERRHSVEMTLCCVKFTLLNYSKGIRHHSRRPMTTPIDTWSNNYEFYHVLCAEHAVAQGQCQLMRMWRIVFIRLCDISPRTCYNRILMVDRKKCGYVKYGMNDWIKQDTIQHDGPRSNKLSMVFDGITNNPTTGGQEWPHITVDGNHKNITIDIA